MRARRGAKCLRFLVSPPMPLCNPTIHPRFDVRMLAPSCALNRRGYNIGVRLIDEFLAKAQVGPCSSFTEAAEVIAKVGFKMFLGVTAEVAARPRPVQPSACGESARRVRRASRAVLGLAYSNMLCGVLRRRARNGSDACRVHPDEDALWGDDVTEIRVVLKEMMEEEYIDEDG